MGLGHNILAQNEGRDKKPPRLVTERLRGWCSCPVVRSSHRSYMGKSRVHAVEVQNSVVDGIDVFLLEMLE